MNNLIKLFSTLLFVFSLCACTEMTQNESSKVASSKPVSKTATEQSPAFMRADPAMNKVRMKMDGTWQDTNNDKRMFVIAGDEYYELYEGRQVAKKKFDIYNACPTENGEVDESGSYIWLRTAIDTVCYEIADLDNAAMILIDVEEGEKLRYERR